MTPISDSNHRNTVSLLSAVTLLTIACTPAFALNLASPDGVIQCVVNPDGTGRLKFEVSYNGQAIVLPSDLGPKVGGQDLGMNTTLGIAATQTIQETYPLNGGHSTANSHCNEAVIPVTGGATTPTAWVLEVRAFNDGVAYRYRIPGSGNRTVFGESSQWKLPAGGTIHYQDAGNNDYESKFGAGTALSALPVNAEIRTTATVALPGPLFVMMTEANLVNYSDMSLRHTGNSTFQVFFKHNNTSWTNTGEILSPWRTTIIAPDLNTLVNTDLLTNLCPAPDQPQLQNNPAWIKPGRSTWHWMVSGRPVFSAQNQWVDWTSQCGFEYYMIDDGWKDWTSPGLPDQWTCMKSVVDYAKTKGVSIWAWVDTNQVSNTEQRQAYFAKAKEAGIVGLKIDFMGDPDTGWVKWYDETLRDAATYQLMVNFHGCVKPSGRERTYPHELTREAVGGREFGAPGAVHDSTLPFTRFVQGHGDYTPTDFRGNKLSGNSYAHELAQAVVYTSPFLCYGGDPSNYLVNPALDIMQTIPSTWDETRVLAESAIGEVAGFARRKGQVWFIGVVNGTAARNFSLNMDFLGTGPYVIDKLADSPSNNAAFVRTRENITAPNIVSADLRGQGGFVARVVPSSLLPAIPTATATGAVGSVDLSWNAVPSATSYLVRRSATAVGTATVIASGVTGLTYTDTSVGAGITQYYTVTAVNAYGSGESSTQMAASASQSGFPAGWTGQDIGSTGATGFAAYKDGVYTVNGAGGDLWGGNDQFHFLSRPWSGDGVFTARVISTDSTNPWAKVGLMFRESVATNSRYAFSLLTPNNGTAFQLRTTESINTNIGNRIAPYWLRLVRNGNTFTSFASVDGSTWTAIGTATANPMAIDLRAGFAVCSHASGTLNTTRFDQVSFLATPASTGAIPRSESQLRLSWNDDSSGQTGYTLERSPASQNQWALISESIPTGIFDDANLEASSSYDYRVTAQGSGGASSLPAAFSGTTPAGVGDGIPGSWRLEYFGDGLSAAGNAAAKADPDGDGMNNEMEYWSGTSPTNSSSVMRLTSLGMENGSFSMSFISLMGKTYTLESSMDLKNEAWATVPEHSAIPGNGDQIQITLTASKNREFFRIRVP
ncbi:MAG: glycoside hydrolase family 97 catalytic domain-containing protein [Luteolibacter sp.]